MKLHFDPALLLLTLSLATPAVAADEERAPNRRAYLIAPAAEPSFRWSADKVARRARADTLVWRGQEPAVPREPTFRRSRRDPGLVLERP
jgi:hypothetical protein